MEELKKGSITHLIELLKLSDSVYETYMRQEVSSFTFGKNKLIISTEEYDKYDSNIILSGERYEYTENDRFLYRVVGGHIEYTVVDKWGDISVYEIYGYKPVDKVVKKWESNSDKKINEVVETILKLHGQEIKITHLFNLMYAANIVALDRIEQPITTSLSKLVGIIKKNNNSFEITEGGIKLKQSKEIEELSEIEEEILKEVYETFAGKTTELVNIESIENTLKKLKKNTRDR
jgi:hypothetical protein